MRRLGVLTVMFLAVLALFSVSANLAGAATAPGGPDGGGYFGLQIATTPTNFVEISKGTYLGTQVLPNADNAFTPALIGFKFNFYGTPYDTAFISSNGLITFGSGTDANVNQPFTGTVTPDIPMIGNLWDDWTTVNLINQGQKTYGDAVYYNTLGTAGNREFIVQWNDVLNMGSIGNNPATFEAILYENGDIRFQYSDVNVGNPDFNDGASATVGIRAAGSNTSNDCFMQWSFNEKLAVSNNQAIVFTKTNPNPTPPSSLYDFTYNYQGESGDSYLGQFYSNQSYTVNQAIGNYTITGIHPGDASKNDQVSVTSYFDGETGRNFPGDGLLFVTAGTTGLGSESGYIINDNPAFAGDYRFGTTDHLEADVVAYAHIFTYNYSDGSKDSYTGTVYAAPEKALAVIDYAVEAAGTRYEGADAVARLNKVDVDSYHDGETGRNFPGDGLLFVTAGTTGLGSESGYIINDNPAFAGDYRFGTTDHLEADVVAYAYGYKFTFSNGSTDSYTGTVYAEPEKGYSTIWSDTRANKVAEQGMTGLYTITGVGSRYEGTAAEALWGKVTVASYWDSEMKRAYTPTFVFNDVGGYLGNEYGFINITTYPTNTNWSVASLENPTLPPGTMKFYFGGGFYEADIKADAATK